ncbi:MAG: hypothetical protein HY645_15470 [Acidobacteria bacterium]|nr:hypothetical protein [Acidobacteriota bacterium]
MSKIRSGVVPLFLALVFIVSLLLLAFGYLQWSVGNQLQQADELEGRGQYDAAFKQYQDLEKQLKRVRWLKTVFREEYSSSRVAQLRVLYKQENFDSVVFKAEADVQDADVDPGAVYFWSGSALYRKGLAESGTEDAFPWYHQALEQFRKGVEEDTQARWNLKYNYELVRTMIEQATKQQEKKPAKVLRRKEEQIEAPNKKIEG